MDNRSTFFSYIIEYDVKKEMDRCEGVGNCGWRTRDGTDESSFTPHTNALTCSFLTWPIGERIGRPVRRARLPRHQSRKRYFLIPHYHHGGHWRHSRADPPHLRVRQRVRRREVCQATVSQFPREASYDYMSQKPVLIAIPLTLMEASSAKWLGGKLTSNLIKSSPFSKGLR